MLQLKFQMSKRQMRQAESPTLTRPHPVRVTCPASRFTDCQAARQKGAPLASLENTALNTLILFSLNLNHSVYINAIYYNLFLCKCVHRSKIK